MDNNENNINNTSNGRKKNGLVIVLVICIAIIIALGGYIIYDKDVFNLSKNDPKESVNKNEDSSNKASEDNSNANNGTSNNEGSGNQNTTTTTTNPQYPFDISKCSNCDSEYTYELTVNGSFAEATLKSDNKTVWVNIDYDTISDGGHTKVNNKGQKGYTLTFNKKVVDIVYATYGIDLSYETILFLMEDGTVEFLPIDDAAIKGQIKSYGQVENIANIVKFYPNISAGVTNGAGGYVTTFAQSSDGTIYDIMTILSKTDNYPNGA